MLPRQAVEVVARDWESWDTGGTACRSSPWEGGEVQKKAPSGKSTA